MISRSFTRMTSDLASTKRSPGKVGGVIGAPEEYLTNLPILPLMPISDEIRQKYEIDSPRETLVTYILGDHDIEEGDILVAGSTEYQILAVGAWYPHDYIEVVVDKIEGT